MSWNPMDDVRAELARVRRVLRYERSREQYSKFVESEHPRDDDGQFSHKRGHIEDGELFKRAGHEFENIQKALGIKRVAMGPTGAQRLRNKLSQHPGGNVIAALLNVDGSETGYDSNGFAKRGNDAYYKAVDGKFTQKELDAAATWLYEKFNNSQELANVNQHRWIRETVRTATTKVS